MLVLEAFRERLINNHPLSDDTWQELSGCLQLKDWSKGEHLCMIDAFAEHIHLVLEGVVKVYVLKDGLKICTNFRFAGQFTASLDSFLTNTPSEYGIEALVDVKTLSISRPDLYRLYAEHPEMNVHGRMVMEALLLEKRYRERLLLTRSGTRTIC